MNNKIKIYRTFKVSFISLFLTLFPFLIFIDILNGLYNITLFKGDASLFIETKMFFTGPHNRWFIWLGLIIGYGTLLLLSIFFSFIHLKSKLNLANQNIEIKKMKISKLAKENQEMTQEINAKGKINPSNSELVRKTVLGASKNNLWWNKTTQEIAKYIYSIKNVNTINGLRYEKDEDHNTKISELGEHQFEKDFQKIMKKRGFEDKKINYIKQKHLTNNQVGGWADFVSDVCVFEVKTTRNNPTKEFEKWGKTWERQLKLYMYLSYRDKGEIHVYKKAKWKNEVLSKYHFERFYQLTDSDINEIRNQMKIIEKAKFNNYKYNKGIMK